MSHKSAIKVIDLFAGPGGLAEGFSALEKNAKRCFDIKLSIEKDTSAHDTLLLRSFCRQFQIGKLPKEYYEAIACNDIVEREKKIKNLFRLYPEEHKNAKAEALLFELGKDSTSFLSKRLTEVIGEDKNWVLIGGPPCQAFSMAGRSRVGGVSKDDHRVFLYKEYLKVIARYSPAVFVMENVKGLLSAEVEGKSVFNMILEDLASPYKVIKSESKCNYKIYSLVKHEVKSAKDYVIASENYGVPQKRHRVILLGVRDDIKIQPDILKKNSKEVKVEEVIADLPVIRSKLNRKFLKYEKSETGKKKRKYEKVEDSDTNWKSLMEQNLNDILKLNGFDEDDLYSIENSEYGNGGEYLDYSEIDNTSMGNSSWYKDKNLKGVLNHQSRSHLVEDLKRYQFSTLFAEKYNSFPRLKDFKKHSKELIPDHLSAESGHFTDRFRVQVKGLPATTITSHISKDGHYFIHYDKKQVRSLTVREAARIQTFPDNYLFRGSRTMQYHQVGNAVPPFLAYQIAKIVKKLVDV